MPTDMMRSERGQGGAALVMSQLAALWRQQSRARKLVAAAVLVGLLVALGWTRLAQRAPAWATVVTAHRDAETSECVAVLQREGIAVRARGRDVEVAPATLARARAVLAASGLPDSGIGLRTFDESSFLASGFAEQVSYKRAQQDELARSIKTLAPIDGARVHLALGHRSLFKDRDQRPSASVSLRLRPGVAISGAQVQGIRQLVVGAVDGMRAEDVAVIDQLGNPLGDEGFGAGGSGGLIGSGQRQLEQEVGDKVRGLLERLVGVGNVEVAVSADVDLRRVEETAEVYERERSAITAETRTREAGGKAGAINAANAGRSPAVDGDAASGAAKAGGDDGLVRASATYAPSHVVTETRFPGARLRRLHLAVVVDVRRGGAELVPPSPSELELWGALVRNAAGLDDSRGDRLELQALPFAAAPSLTAEGAATAGTTSGAPELGPLSAETLFTGVIALLTLLTLGGLGVLAMRRRYATRLAASERRVEAAEAQAAQSERRAAAMSSTVELGGGSGRGAEHGERLGERAGEVVRRDLDGAALVLSAWLSGDDDAAVEAAPRGEGRGMKGALS